jgi:hypothetical protein
MRSGVGTIRRFRGNESGVAVGIQTSQGPGIRVLPCDPELADRLVKQFGRRTSETYTDMEGLIGLQCRWTETNMGVWSHIEALAN